MSPQQREVLNTVKRSTDLLSRLIHNVLDFSKMESGPLEYQMVPQDLVPILEDVVEDFRPMVKEKGLNFLITEPLP